MASIADVRAKLESLGPDAPALSVFELRVTLAHLLSATGRQKESDECLTLGEQLWAEAASDSLQHPGSVAHLKMTLAGIMKRAAATSKRVEAAVSWAERMENVMEEQNERVAASQPGTQFNMGPSSGSGQSKAPSTRRQTLFADQNPVLNWAHARKNDRNAGPRYTTWYQR